MKTVLHIIVDCSGSMNEMGKIHLQRNLCRYAAQLKLIEQEEYAYLDVLLYKWSESISEITIQSDGDIPTLNAKGSSNLISLSDFISDKHKDNKMMRVLILSDGNFPVSDITIFKERLKTLSNLVLHTVAVGADADHFKLKKISTNDCVCLSENIATAIVSIFYQNYDPVTAPKSTHQIAQTKVAETKEKWDV